MKKLMLGNEAIARGVYEAGATVSSAYPGTPSTEITEYIKAYSDIYSEWAPNEKVAMEVAIGASIAGARAVCAMKHVGLNVAADPLFTVSYTGVNGGLVVFVADDPGMHSSQNEQDTRMLAIAAKVPVLEPSDSEECKEFTKRAFLLSEQFDTPIIIRLTTRVSHSQGLVTLNEKIDYKLKDYVKNISKNVMMPAMAVARHVFVEQRLSDMTEFSNTSDLNKIEMNDKKIGIITSGISYQYAKEAMPTASFLKLGLVYPLPLALIERFAQSVDTLYVIEELDPFIETFCKANGLAVIGKEKFSILGEFSTEIVRKAMTGSESEFKTISESIPNRPPVMCPGCPHRGMHYVLKKLGLVVTGDIGCYTLGALPPMQSLDTCICMGASIGMAHGMDKARGGEFAKRLVGILGDSTFIHSGITPLINIVYNKGVSTIIILDNSITGMTGHQDNPTTGYTLKGEPTKQVNLEKLCEAVGIDRVVIADPFDLAAFEAVVKEELNANEPSVIIARRPCALLKTVKFKGPVFINKGKCINCKMCMRLGCPAISLTETGPVIDETLCVGCGLCKNVCKPNAIEDRGDTND